MQFQYVIRASVLACCFTCMCALGAAAQPEGIETGLSPQTRTPAPWTLPLPPTLAEQIEAEATIESLLRSRPELISEAESRGTEQLRQLARGDTR
ncbi:MAG: hypothetical protein ACR2GY_05205 [Phycisphaerales bacterium]